ncbi:hypothetical protein Tco_0452529 [Tanacetum coccineum]
MKAVVTIVLGSWIKFLDIEVMLMISEVLLRAFADLKGIRLLRSKMSFHQALDLILELDEATVRCTRDILRQRDFPDRLSEVPWVVPTFVVIEGEKETLLDVDGTSGCRYGVLRSFPMERIKQGNEHVLSLLSPLRSIIMEYLVKVSKKARILELNRRYLKITVMTTNTSYPSRKIRRICVCTLLKTMKETRSIRQEKDESQKRILQYDNCIRKQLADLLLHHEVEERVDELVEELEELENQRGETMKQLVNLMVKEMTEVLRQMEVSVESLTFSTIISQQLQNLLPTLLAQVGSQGSNQGNNRNQNGDASMTTSMAMLGMSL